MRTPPRSLAFALLLSLSPAIIAPPCFAQGTADPTLAAAHARFEEGVRFFDKGEYENARAAFLQAYALHKHPAVLINLAQSSLRSGHVLEADRFFARYLKEAASLTPAQKADAEKGLADARTKLGRLDVLAPQGVAVTVDGELAGTDGSTTVDVEPGAHQVKGGTETSSVTVAAGQTLIVRLGKSSPVPPPVVAPLPVPTPDVPPPPTTPEPPPPDDTQPHPSIFSRPATVAPVAVGATVGVVGFATAILFGVFKGNAVTSFNNENTQITNAVGGPTKAASACTNPKASASLMQACGSLTNDQSQVSSDATVANVGIAAGIVGAGFALGWYLFAPKAAAKPASGGAYYVEPVVGPRSGGFSLGATF